MNDLNSPFTAVGDCICRTVVFRRPAAAFQVDLRTLSGVNIGENQNLCALKIHIYDLFVRSKSDHIRIRIINLILCQNLVPCHINQYTVREAISLVSDGDKHVCAARRQDFINDTGLAEALHQMKRRIAGFPVQRRQTDSRNG